MSGQLFLFQTDTVARADGSFVVTPKRLVDGKEITAAKAASMLGFKDKETVYGLIRTKQIKGWKPESARDNGKYRIDLGSVIDYKARRQAVG